MYCGHSHGLKQWSLRRHCYLGRLLANYVQGFCSKQIPWFSAYTQWAHFTESNPVRAQKSPTLLLSFMAVATLNASTGNVGGL